MDNKDTNKNLNLNSKTKTTSSKGGGPEKKRKAQLSEFGIQMKEKQNIKKSYGVSEKQFSAYVKDAQKNTINTKISPALGIYNSLEKRLDNIIFRMGFAKTRPLARQIVNHGHILVNAKKIDIPSHKVKIGDLISIREGSKATKLFINIPVKEKDFHLVDWISVDISKLEAKVLSFPKDIEAGFDFTKVLEFYNK